MTPEQCIKLSQQVRQHAGELAALTDWLDISAVSCSCCTSTRYNNWPQKQMYDQMAGVAERLNNIANTLERRADDPQFTSSEIRNDYAR